MVAIIDPETLPQARSLRDELLAAALLHRTGVAGLYLRSAAYQSIADAMGGPSRAGRPARTGERARHAGAGAHRHLPGPTTSSPSRSDRIGAHLRRHRPRTSRARAESCRRRGLVGTRRPGRGGACSGGMPPHLPLCSGAGPVPSLGRYYEVRATCFRHEPSDDVMRMQSFQMHELVYVGDPDGALAHHDTGLDEGLDHGSNSRWTRNEPCWLITGRPLPYDDVIAAVTPDAAITQMCAGYAATVLVGGHTHIPMIRRYADAHLVNVGSVGLAGITAGTPELPRKSSCLLGGIWRAQRRIGAFEHRSAPHPFEYDGRAGRGQTFRHAAPCLVAANMGSRLSVHVGGKLDGRLGARVAPLLCYWVN